MFEYRARRREEFRSDTNSDLHDRRIQWGNDSALTDFSLAPIYLFKISGPLTLIKLSPHSFATAEASIVFPHPGYPYSSSLRIH